MFALALWSALACANEPARVAVPSVGEVWETTSGSVLAGGHGVERPVTPDDGPPHTEIAWVEPFPTTWASSPSNPHGSYVEVPVGALVEAVAVRAGTTPVDVATVAWYVHAPEKLAGTLFLDSFVVERSEWTRVFTDTAVRTDRPPAFDAAAWQRLADAHPSFDLSTVVSRPER